MSRTAAIAFAFTSLLTLSSAPAAFADNAPATDQGGMRGFLTPQQRAVLMMENRDKWKSMSEDDRHTAREKMRNDWMAMSQTDREKKRAALQAKWDALPQAQKDELNTRMQRWAQHRAQGGDSQ